MELTKESGGIIVTGGIIRDEDGGLNGGIDPQSGMDLTLTLFNEETYYSNKNEINFVYKSIETVQENPNFTCCAASRVLASIKRGNGCNGKGGIVNPRPPRSPIDGEEVVAVVVVVEGDTM